MLFSHRARVAALVGALGLHAVSCASDDGHAPFASATCRVPPCAVGAVIGQRSPGGAGGADAGGPTPDSGAVGTSDCHVDPTLLIEMCSRSQVCKGVFVDPVVFNGCGFLGAGVDVECVCNVTTLCPIAVQTSCDYLSNQLKTKSLLDICAPATAGGCRDASNLPPSGSGGASSTCDRDCAMRCSNSPACVQACGC